MPCVLDMPVRFTDSPNASAKKQGVYKNSRGWLRGWKLPEAEAQRVDGLTDPEVVLQHRPVELQIEVVTATKLMPLIAGKRIYTLKMTARRWTLGKGGAVKVLRYGFPIVPDFGGTAHAYCGTTLDACLGDLLPWYIKPRLEDALRAYIIKSRVRDASRILLAQPYSPQLFRQGAQIGPHLLMGALQGTITFAEAKRGWKEAEQKPAAQDILKSKYGKPIKWPYSMRLPCRRCTDKNKGIEVTLPLKLFTTAVDMKEVWRKTIARGQDMSCVHCVYAMNPRRPPKEIMCSACETLLARTKFDEENQRLWDTLSDEPLACAACAGARRSAEQRRNADPIFCNGECQRVLPEYQFQDEKLLDWRAKDLLILAKCARCIVLDMKANQ